MIDPITLSPMTYAAHAEDALDLATRAADYVTLEVGHAPDAGYVTGFFSATTPRLSEDFLQHFAIMEGTAMSGMVCIAKGYEFPEDWWIGLLLIDPAFRGRGIGRKVLRSLRDRARRQDVAMLKLSVLQANPCGLRFWRREGFVHHRDAPALPGSDGHDRVVLKYLL